MTTTQNTLRTDAEVRALLEESKRTRERLHEARQAVTYYATCLRGFLQGLAPTVDASADRIDLGLLLKAIDGAIVAGGEHERAYEAWHEAVVASRVGERDA